MRASGEIILFLQTLGAGGAERVAVRLANYWAASGTLVTVLLVRAEGALLPELDTRVTVYELGGSRTIHVARDAWRFLAKNPNAVVLLFGLEIGRVAGLGRWMGYCQNRLVYREQTNPSSSGAPIRRWTYRYCVSRVDRIVVQNETALAALRAFGVMHPKVYINKNPVYKKIGRSTSKSINLADGLRLVAVGRLVEVKGFARLIRAFPYLLTHFRDCKLTIWGDGPERRRLEALVNDLSLSESVFLPGHCYSEETIWTDADVFILSSHFEGQPNALLEAIANGVRVVATCAGGGVAELLREIGFQDMLIDGDRFAHGCNRAIQRAVSLPVEKYSAGRDRFIELFDWDKCIRAYDTACFDNSPDDRS